ncbi:hypothetical protein H1C71_025133 [Ictidomys tridecemlineatus]|nr:hypothetical protein H1C71_025133 [Ictidomys tridecemlineatus]
MFTISSSQRNANQNHPKIPSHSSQTGSHYEVKQQQVLARMWGKGYTYTLLVGLQIGAANLESSIEIPGKAGNRTTVDPAIALLGLFSEELKRVYYRDTASWMFRPAQFTIARLWYQPRCPSIDEWIKKMWHLYTMEYYTALKNDKIMEFAGKWMALEQIMLSEASQSLKNKCQMSSLI